tara:strand:+ start:1057 stop:1779 length:723 start_codon:yes stop_codon:yes gene_type:complete
MVRFKMNNLNRKIKLYADGPDLSEINKKIIFNLDGYTFNPSLFRKLGVKNYLDFCKKIIRKCSNKPISFEVFGDDEETMFRQALILSNLSKNIYVKIPITYTNGKSTKKLLSKLVKKRIPLNITAIFTLRQIKTILPIVKNTNSILSIFAGRIYDCGHDAYAEMEIMNKYIKKNSKCKSLWASCRMPFDIIKAIKTKTDIITMSIPMIKKIKNFVISKENFSKQTVKQFFLDAKKSNYKL